MSADLSRPVTLKPQSANPRAIVPVPVPRSRARARGEHTLASQAIEERVGKAGPEATVVGRGFAEVDTGRILSTVIGPPLA